MLFLGIICISGLYSQVTKISDTPGEAELPFIKIMRDGNIMVIYSEGHSFNGDAILYFHIYDQATKSWSGPKVAVPKYFSSAYAQIDEDDDGNLHMVYHDGNSSSNREIYYTTYNITSKKWGARHLVYQSAGVNSTWPRIQVDGQNIFIVWSHNYDSSVGEMDIVMVENTIGGTWPVDKAKRRTISDTSQSVSIHADFKYRDGKIYCIWMDDNHQTANWNIYYNEGTYNPNANSWQWGTAYQPFPSGPAQYYPALVLDDDGVVHVVYSNKQNPVWHARKTSGGWKAPKEISKTGTSITMFLVLKYKQGLLHTVWRQGTDVYYGRGLPDGTWADPVKVADGKYPGYPGLDVDTKGDVHVVWTDDTESHPRNVYYTKVDLPGMPPTAVLKANPTIGLTPLKVTFNGADSSDSDGNIVDYRWSFGDGTQATGKRVKHTYTESGIFTASLTVIDNDMRTDTAQVEITVSTGVPVPVIEVSATSGMIPLTVNFDGSKSSDFDGTIQTYLWDFGDGTSTTGVTATHTYENGGKYTASLTVTDNDGKSDTAYQNITVFQKPVAIFTATPEVGKPPLEVFFDASDSYDPDGYVNTYKWDYGDGFNSLSKKERHTYSTPGTFMVVFTAVDDDHVTDTATTTIRVLDKPLPPTNVAVQTLVNRSFMYTDYINKITWQEDSNNSGLFTVVNYRIYRKAQSADDSQFTMLREVSATTLEYQDRGISDSNEASGYVYVITAVDDAGLESPVSAYAVKNN